MWVIGKGIEWQGRNSARPWQTSLLAATAPPAFGARWPTAGRRPCLVYAIPFGHRRQSRPYHVAAGTLPREEASRGRPVELGGEDAPALDGTDPAHKDKVQTRRQVCDVVLRIDKAEPGERHTRPSENDPKAQVGALGLSIAQYYSTYIVPMPSRIEYCSDHQRHV